MISVYALVLVALSRKSYHPARGSSIMTKKLSTKVRAKVVDEYRSEAGVIKTIPHPKHSTERH